MISPCSRAQARPRARRCSRDLVNERAARLVPVTGQAGHSAPRKRTRAAPSDRSSSRWQRARPPLSTGCPGPFHAQPPIQPDERPRPVRPDRATPGLEGGWMRAPPAVGVALKPDESAGPADEPGAGPEQQLTLDRGNVNRVRSTHGEGSITFSNHYGECRCSFSLIAYGPSRRLKSSVGFV
jgi:hypothetical protein